MAKTFVKVEGLKELEKALMELPRATARNVMSRSLLRAAQPVVDLAQANAPVLTGRLKASIHASTKKPKGAKGAGAAAFAKAMRGGATRAQAGQAARAANASAGSSVEVFIGPGRHPKGLMQEFGTRFQAPQPYLRPAWDAKQAAVLDTIKALTWDEISKAAARLAKKQARLAAKLGS